MPLKLQLSRKAKCETNHLVALVLKEPVATSWTQVMTKTTSHPPSTYKWQVDLSKLKLPSSINCLIKGLKEWVALRFAVESNCQAFSNQAENKL